MPQVKKNETLDAKKTVVNRRNRGSALYKNIYYIGIQTRRYGKRFAVRIKKFILLPVANFFVAVFSFLYTAINLFLVRSVSSFVQEGKYFNKELRSAKSHISRAVKKSSASAFAVLWYYIKKIFRHHRDFIVKSTYTIMPVLGAVVLALTIGYWSNSTFALEITYDGKNIGYIADESVYLEAKQLAENMLDLDSNASLLSAPSYNLTSVSINKLNDSDTIFNNIIKNSENNLTNACGIYINGEFLCSVMNELDAKSVFENILSKYSVNLESGVTIGFYEDIDYVQGLYPNDERTMWDASQLADTLNSEKSSSFYYTVKDGDTVSGIAETYKLSVSELLALNLGLSEDHLTIGQELLVSAQVKYFHIKVMKTESRDVVVKYTTEQSESSQLFKGTTKTIQKGSDGLERVTEIVTYVEGERVSVQEINRVVVKNMVPKKVAIGTKTTTTTPAKGLYSLTKNSSGFVWPAIGAYSVTDGFGYYEWRGRMHKGVDISGGGANGKTIVAAADGTVTYAGWKSNGYGYHVKIDHGNGLETLYAHCLEGSIGVSAGQKVSQGQAIAKIGSTGNSTGPHLHFEVIINGTKVDPQPYLGY